jgi:hypothetical protein
MTKFLAYLHAPSTAQLRREFGDSFQWQTAAYIPALLEPSALELASQRVSLYYRNVIFDDSTQDKSMDEVAGVHFPHMKQLDRSMSLKDK